ncbi:MAG: hypothetical protein AAF567_15750 [Actinomycetota bacterium]
MSELRPLAALIDGDPLRELDAARDAAWQAVDVGLLGLCGQRMAMLLGHEGWLEGASAADLEALADWPRHEGFGERERTALALTEQYLIDVASATDDQVAMLAEHLDGSIIDFVNALLVIEQRMRLELGLSAVLA